MSCYLCLVLYLQASFDGGNMWQRKPIHLTTDGEKEKEKERWVSYNPLQGHASSDLKSPIRPNLLKAPLLPNSTKLRTKR
jgi:hypothetical protein